VVEPTEGARIGDIVLTLAERGLTAHRVIARRGDDLVTRGDNAPAPDAPVHVSRVIGRVAGVERDGRTFAPRRWWRFAIALRRSLAGMR
jgi:hypothetical protein